MKNHTKPYCIRTLKRGGKKVACIVVTDHACLGSFDQSATRAAADLTPHLQGPKWHLLPERAFHRGESSDGAKLSKKDLVALLIGKTLAYLAPLTFLAFCGLPGLP